MGYRIVIVGLLFYFQIPSIAKPVQGDPSMDNPSIAADPCLKTLGASSPGMAAALVAKKAVAQKQAIDHFKKGRGEGPEDLADAQITAQEAGEGAQIGGDYTESSSPIFAAGAAKEMDPIKKNILMQCADKRGRQGMAQKAAAAADRKVAEIARRDDSTKGKQEESKGEAPKYQIVDLNVSGLMR